MSSLLVSVVVFSSSTLCTCTQDAAFAIHPLLLANHVALPLRSQVPQALQRVLAIRPRGGCDSTSHICLVCEVTDSGRDRDDHKESEACSLRGPSKVHVAVLLHSCRKSVSQRHVAHIRSVNAVDSVEGIRSPASFRYAGSGLTSVREVSAQNV